MGDRKVDWDIVLRLTLNIYESETVVSLDLDLGRGNECSTHRDCVTT